MKQIDPNAFEVLKSFEDKKSRFDYFIIGTSLAIVAFTAQQFDGSKQHECFFLVAISWALFLITAAMGIWFVRQEVAMAEFRYLQLLDRTDENKQSNYQQWRKEEPCRRRVVLFCFFLGIALLCIFRVINGFQ